MKNEDINRRYVVLLDTIERVARHQADRLVEHHLGGLSNYVTEQVKGGHAVTWSEVSAGLNELRGRLQVAARQHLAFQILEDMAENAAEYVVDKGRSGDLFGDLAAAEIDDDYTEAVQEKVGAASLGAEQEAVE